MDAMRLDHLIWYIMMLLSVVAIPVMIIGGPIGWVGLVIWIWALQKSAPENFQTPPR
jgi:ABC-type Fe3+-siderophore transport system permease subunit